MDQLTLGFERKESGQRAALSRDQTWLDSVVRYVEQLPFGFEVDAELIRTVCGSPESPNAMGAALSVLRKKKLIKKYGWKVANRASRHAAEIRVWLKT